MREVMNWMPPSIYNASLQIKETPSEAAKALVWEKNEGSWKNLKSSEKTYGLLKKGLETTCLL